MLIISTSSRLGVGKDEEEEEKEMKKEGSIRGCGGKGEESWKATNNYHQSSSSQHFHMLRLPVIGSSQRCVWGCVCRLCLAHHRLFSLSSPLPTLMHKQQQLRNHSRQQEAGRCVNSPSTILGCARLQKTQQRSYLPF